MGIVQPFLAVAGPLWADHFPRGPGFYYSPFKIVFFLAIYLIWIKTSVWVNNDLRKLKNDEPWWNPLFLGVGVIGFLLLWATPLFWLTWLLFVGVFAAVSLWYVNVRNDM